MKLYKYLIAALAFTIIFTSCGEDFLDAENTENLDSETASKLASENPESLNAYLRGVWVWMVKYNVSGSSSSVHDDFSYMSVLHASDMMCEDIAMTASHYFIYDYDLDDRMQDYRRPLVNWVTFYTMIAKANEIIGFFPEEPTSSGSKAILGQGYAIRGMAYYYLIQLFSNPTGADGKPNLTVAGVPMLYSSVESLSEDEQTKLKGRNTVDDVYKQIESDLTKAVSYLESAEYNRPSKIFIDANVANGLLARYYLLDQQWEKAAEAAKKAHNDYTIMEESGLHDGFMDIENKEWMWGFDHSTETQTTYASFFSHISNLVDGYAGDVTARLIDKRLYEQISETDYRKSLFNGPDGDATQTISGARKPYANIKFGNDGTWTMDYVYMRAAEMVLIEAEAYAHLGREADAATAMKKLMENRDPSWNKTAMSVEDIYLQRRIELWGEGFGYFDLKRLNKGIDRNYEGSNHLTGYKHKVDAQDVRWTYQIPIRELQENKQISEEDQNP